jgi:hypothetical protein
MKANKYLLEFIDGTAIYTLVRPLIVFILYYIKNRRISLQIPPQENNNITITSD